MGREGEVRACYPASGAGNVLQRALREWDVHGEVVAPGLIPWHREALLKRTGWVESRQGS